MRGNAASSNQGGSHGNTGVVGVLLAGLLGMILAIGAWLAWLPCMVLFCCFRALLGISAFLSAILPFPEAPRPIPIVWVFYTILLFTVRFRILKR